MSCTCFVFSTSLYDLHIQAATEANFFLQHTNQHLNQTRADPTTPRFEEPCLTVSSSATFGTVHSTTSPRYIPLIMNRCISQRPIQSNLHQSSPLEHYLASFPNYPFKQARHARICPKCGSSKQSQIYWESTALGKEAVVDGQDVWGG